MFGDAQVFVPDDSLFIPVCGVTGSAPVPASCLCFFCLPDGVCLLSLFLLSPVFASSVCVRASVFRLCFCCLRHGVCLLSLFLLSPVFASSVCVRASVSCLCFCCLPYGFCLMSFSVLVVCVRASVSCLCFCCPLRDGFCLLSLFLT